MITISRRRESVLNCWEIGSQLWIAILAGGLLATASVSQAEYVTSGPAAGGGLDTYAAPAVGTALTSSEFRKLDCEPGETRVGRDSFYTCGGRVYKKDNIAGRRVYVVVNAVPY